MDPCIGPDENKNLVSDRLAVLRVSIDSNSHGQRFFRLRVRNEVRSIGNSCKSQITECLEDTSFHLFVARRGVPWPK